MYGYGLYAAADPLETVFYSSRDPERWMMTEMIIPAGFRMVDLSVDSPQTVTNPAVIQNAAEIAMKFGCESVSGHPAQELSEYFSLGGAWIPKTCSALIKTIFKDILKIDGIAYFYGAAMYSACTRTDNVYTRRAFVLATSDWITSSNVKVYTSKTTAELEDRIRIQTLVLNGIINPWGLQLTSSADSISVITAADASNQRPQTLIWADLDNKPKTPDVGTWIKANIFGCIPDSPYTVAK